MNAVIEPRAASPAAPDTGHPSRSMRSSFAHDVLEGLAHRRKRVACQWLYDFRGAQLFEQLLATPEYYVGRHETLILERAAEAIARLAGERAVLVELGSGSSRKTPLLLSALERPALYVPIDLGEAWLGESVGALARRFPQVAMQPLVADFTRLEQLPRPPRSGRPVVFFPGSTIGNFAPDEAAALLQRIGRVAGPGALMVVGVDHNRDPASLVAAYDDRQGATAAFNLNLLTRINRELQGDFAPSAFRHLARFDVVEQRVEMHLVAQFTHRVRVLGRGFDFAMGESILTECAHKPSLFQFLAMAHRAGWAQRQLWMDGAARMAVHVLENVSAP